MVKSPTPTSRIDGSRTRDCKGLGLFGVCLQQRPHREIGTPEEDDAREDHDDQAKESEEKTSVAQPEHKVYPYRLNNVDITEPDQVWSTDITYLPMPTGFMYLSAVIDWYSRYILSWALSNTLDGYFCLDALHTALAQSKPESFNTDQGAQFTWHRFIDALETEGACSPCSARCQDRACLTDRSCHL